MDESPHDDRMRHLQRIAYGAVASDAERTAAVAELESLRREQAAATDASAAPSGVEPTPGAAGLEASAPEVSVHRAAEDPARPLKWAITAGTAALLLGVAVGWSVGARMPATEAQATAHALGPAVADDAAFMPVAETKVPRLFETEPTPADVPLVPTLDERIATTDYRLLMTRPDGVTLHVARVQGDVCVIVAVPAFGTAAGCTTDGVFPMAGLWVEGRMSSTSIRGTIQTDGTASLTPVGYLPEAMPATAG